MSPQRSAVGLVLRYAFSEGRAVSRLGSIAVTAGLLAALVAWFGGWLTAGIVLVVSLLALVMTATAYRLALALDRHEREPEVFLVFTDTEVAAAELVERRPRPERVRPGGVGSAEAVTATSFQSFESYMERRGKVFWFARVRVANDPPAGRRGKRAERVAARIAFLGEDGTELLAMDGRWAETSQLAERSSLSISLEGAVLDIDANGMSHPLDIAMKRPGEAFHFAYNDENTYGDQLGLDKHRIDEEHVRARVTLRPANADPVTREFTLTRGSSYGPLELTFADGFEAA